MPVFHLIEVSVPREKIAKFSHAMEELGLTFRDTDFKRYTDLDAFLSGAQTSVDDDFQGADNMKKD